MATYGYLRVSTLHQASEGENLDVQRRQVEGWALMQGLDLADVFTECGVSGSIPIAERPEGARLWGLLRKGDTVVAGKLDRLFRSALNALQTVEALRARGVSLVMLDLGGDVAGNGLSKLFLTIAEAERDRIRERVSQVKADQRSRGRYLGGIVPFGFTVEAGALVAHPGQQEATILARRLWASGSTMRAVAAGLADAGHPLSLGAVHRILTASALT